MKDRTREKGTEDDYDIRAIRTIRRFEKHVGEYLHESSHMFCDWLIDITTGKTDANWRQLKASCIHYFNKEDPELSASIEMLDNKHTVTKSLSISTSSQKKKSISEDEEFKICTKLVEEKSFYDKPLLAIFNATLSVGLRPCEWETVELFMHSIPEADIPPPILRVENAKNTNGRSFGEYRYLGLGSLNERQLLYIQIAIATSQNPSSPDGKSIPYSEFYTKIRNRFYRVVKDLFPKNKKRVTLYSARHQLIANLKKSDYPLEQIACIVGHGNDVTASEHYGKKKVGKHSKSLPIANPSDLEKIKRIYTQFTPGAKVNTVQNKSET